jgi:neutral trehalase
VADFREYRPDHNARTSRIPPRLWEDMRSSVLDLYLQKNKTIEQVAATMKENHGFEAKYPLNVSCFEQLLTSNLNSERQYEHMFKKWKIAKHVPSQVMRHAARKIHENPRRHDFTYKQRSISPLDLERFQSRNPDFAAISSPTACKIHSYPARNIPACIELTHLQQPLLK